MTSIEQTGKSVEEATEVALEKLGVTEDQVDVEILDEGTKGFLGLGQNPARVRVTPKSQERVQETAKAAAPSRKPARQPKEEAAPAPAPPAPTTEPAPAPAVSSEELLKQGSEISRDVLQHILDGIGTGAKAVVKSTADGQVFLDMVEGDPAILIGKHGQTIDAIQYLVGVITNRRLPEKVRVIIDAEGYRERREEALRSQAHFLADKVRETGQEAVLDALQANERRIIHTALADDKDVYTYSEGEEPDRRVVISPRK